LIPQAPRKKMPLETHWCDKTGKALNPRVTGKGRPSGGKKTHFEKKRSNSVYTKKKKGRAVTRAGGKPSPEEGGEKRLGEWRVKRKKRKESSVTSENTDI